MQVAIDGPASSGKSTIAKKIAAEQGFIYLDTGAMYRVVTYAALKNGIRPGDEEAVAALLPTIQIEFKEGQQVYYNEENVTETIRELEVTRHVSEIAAQKLVRQEMVKRQQEIAQKHSIIMDGRDIGTVVLPNAELKVFLIATAQERANRRFKENQARGISQSYEELLAEIKKRDELDSTRKESPLKKAEDAVELDTTQLTIDEVVYIVNQWIAQKQG